MISEDNLVVVLLPKIKRYYMIESRVPTIKDGEAVGAVGKVLFRYVDDLSLKQLLSF